MRERVKQGKFHVKVTQRLSTLKIDKNSTESSSTYQQLVTSDKKAGNSTLKRVFTFAVSDMC